MSPTLARSDRTKLAKLLALLSLDQIGERAAAGAAADRFLKSRDLTWEEALALKPMDRPLPELGTWRETCRKLMQFPGALKPWERSFVGDLPKFPRLSTKQRYVLKEIADRVLGEGER